MLPMICSSDRKVKDGSLIEVPKHCKKMNPKCEEFYRKIATIDGIHTCPCGYSSGVFKGKIFTCIKISKYYNRNSIKRYEEPLNNPVLTESQVYKIIQQESANETIVAESKTFLEKTKLILHDARQMNAEIKYKSDSLNDHINRIVKESKRKISCDEALDAALKIWHNSNMILNMYSMIDVFLNPASVSYGAKSKCNVFNKFFKVKKIMDNKAKEKDIEIVMHNYLDNTNIEVYQSFDQVPFIILDNAIKYSEPNSRIEITFEKKGQIIYVQTVSVGPLVRDDELKKIFENEYRGQYAIKATTQGSGIGLYLAKTICDVCGLKIYANSVPLTPLGKYTNRAYFKIIVEGSAVEN